MSLLGGVSEIDLRTRIALSPANYRYPFSILFRNCYSPWRRETGRGNYALEGTALEVRIVKALISTLAPVVLTHGERA
jgi:hypothetical protein